ncbi:MAG: dienelactone hydrolase family protein [Spirochaetota bacterium]
MRRFSVPILFSVLVLSACVSLEDEVTTRPETNVTYSSSDGTRLTGHLAIPDGDGPFPAVMMIHEWWGLNQDIVIMAQALADEGYVVMAPDALRGELATNVPAAIALNTGTPDEQIHADLDGALAFLKAHEAVDPARIATMGFCFGGRHSMRLGARADGLAAVVTLYGSDLITDPAEMGSMAENAPVLGIFGEEDGSIPLSEVRAFERALEAVGAEHTIVVYPDAGHAFVKSSTFEGSGPAGDAWETVLEFFERVLGPDA